VDIVQIVGLCLVTTVLVVIVKAQRPEMAVLISIAAGILIFFVVVGRISAVLDLLNNYTRKMNIDITFLSVLLKIIGIAYITEFGAEICKDAGEGAMASKIELAGKVIIAVLAVPIITSLLDIIIKIIP
jgi:stage III sporulation protein AD